MSQVFRSQSSVISLKELVDNLSKNDFKSFKFDLSEKDFDFLSQQILYQLFD